MVSSNASVCWLFCCPPCPSKIVAKMAFLPPECTYEFRWDSELNLYKMIPNRQTSHKLSCTYNTKKLDCFFAKTKRKNRIACIYINYTSASRYTILYSHGNCIDLGQLCGFQFTLASKINCNVLIYDYSGYGLSTGKPSEKNIYADIEAALRALEIRYGICPKDVILYGFSLGTAPSVNLAAKYKVGGVILHSPPMSGIRVFYPRKRRTCCCDPFQNIDKIGKVTSPVLVIHGTEDEVIGICHGRNLYNKCRNAVEPLWMEGAGHNGIERCGLYWERLKKFIYGDLVCIDRGSQC